MRLRQFGLMALPPLVEQDDAEAAGDDEHNSGERQRIRQIAPDEQAGDNAPERKAVEERGDCRGAAKPIGKEKADVPDSEEKSSKGSKSEVAGGGRFPGFQAEL